MNTETTKNRTTRTIAVDVRIARKLREEAAKADGMTIGILADRLLAKALGLQLVATTKEDAALTPEEPDDLGTFLKDL